VNTRPGLIFDFDQTLTKLDVNWELLRAELQVDSLSNLWETNPDRWEVVASREIDAALVSPINHLVYRLWEKSSFVAVLSNNSERAIRAFLERLDHAHQWLVVGRETLGGPKQTPRIFREGVRKILEASGFCEEDFTYIGDEEYEMSYAQLIGLSTLHVKPPFGL
jgi:phosphoglycolate phosphatase-like HAD superfamily hydrolase